MTRTPGQLSAGSRDFIRNVLALLTGNVLAQAVTYLTIPIITRLFPPSAFGVFALFFSLASILISVSNLRYNAAILVCKEEHEADAVALLCLFVTCGISLAVFLWMTFAGRLTPGLSSLPAGAPVLLSAAVFLGGVLQLLGFWRLRTREFRLLAISRVGMSLGSRLASLLWGLFSASPLGLILGHLGGQCLSLAPLLVRGRGRPLGAILSSAALALVPWAARRFKRFPLFAWTSLAEVGNRELPALLLGAFFPASLVGFYAVSGRILGQPMHLAGDAVSRVYFQRASELAEAKPELAALSLTLLRYSTLLLAFPLAVLLVFAPEFLALALGSEWTEAAPYIRAVTPLFFATFVTRPFTVLFDLQERQKERSLMSVSLLAFSSAALALGGVLGLPLAGVILASSASALLHLAFCAWLLARIGIRPGAALGVLGSDILKALAFAAPILAAGRWGGGPAAAIVATCIATAAYAAFIWKTEGELVRLAAQAWRGAPGSRPGGQA